MPSARVLYRPFSFLAGRCSHVTVRSIVIETDFILTSERFRVPAYEPHIVDETGRIYLLLSGLPTTLRLAEDRFRRWWPIADRAMRSNGIVQLNDRTPTVPTSANFSILGIPGPGSRSTFTKSSTRMTQGSSVAAFPVRYRIDGWRFQPGCSIGS